ncbi:hypothetical protein ACWFNS_09050 [Oerskovia enterophila]
MSRVVEHVDRYLAFRVAVMPRRIEGPGTGGEGAVPALAGHGAQFLRPVR